MKHFRFQHYTNGKKISAVAVQLHFQPFFGTFILCNRLFGTLCNTNTLEKAMFVVGVSLTRLHSPFVCCCFWDRIALFFRQLSLIPVEVLSIFEPTKPTQ